MSSQLSHEAHTLVLSYLSIRRGIGLIGILLPILLAPVGWLLFDIQFQDNLSSYYHTDMRDVFVGSLCAIGIFLFCYRGYDSIENWTANLGCFSALGVALFPLDPNSDPLYQRSIVGYVHSFSGGLFFLTLAMYSLFHFPSASAAKHEIAPHEAERNFVYRTSGLVILLSMLAMGTYLFLFPIEWKRTFNQYNFLLWMEWIAVWAFACAWLTKGRTMVADLAVDVLAIPSQILHKQGGKRK
ncbi:hypothetical protein [Roseimaritima ulvae]|uniref:DUF998 domain-containing protein n=1 Tax=Roseimaritima ulvae TaxID=980254 RepID=A0A5B9QTA4_9BACT|nr:hypothetical protein [Roseimaritima ulvae]QEG41142.1 hypothetical protein UC8_31610 [Roseimaritima ulvae]